MISIDKDEIINKIHETISFMIRHEGNILELEKQLKQITEELLYEKEQFQNCTNKIIELKQQLEM